ncbi:class I SAM-dependent methyltransferase [Corynebacterium diphtheriae]|nr:class I SAM-dependent methyltransferase [Corynebacterium diphtheriae]
MDTLFNSTYGTLSERSLHEVWDKHEFCFPVLKKMITTVPGIDSIVDLGCGSGKMLSSISQLNSGLTLIGIDSSKVAIDSASLRLGDNALFVKGDLSNVIDFEGERCLVYSSGFTSNLFSENDWARIVTRWLFNSPSVYAFVYDTFWWPHISKTVRQDGVFEGKDASLRWSVERNNEGQTSYNIDKNTGAITSVRSFNHKRRSLSFKNTRGVRTYEVLHKKVELSGGFSTESCTCVIARTDS